MATLRGGACSGHPNAVQGGRSRDSGAAGVAAPIFNADGSVTAGLLIAAPIERFEKQLPQFKRLLHEATSIVSGITPPPTATEPKQPRSRAARTVGRGGD